MVVSEIEVTSEDKEKSSEPKSEEDRSTGKEREVVQSSSSVKIFEEREKPFSSLNGHEGIVICLCYNQTGNMLASGCENGIVNIWSVPVSLLIFSPPLTTPYVSLPPQEIAFRIS